MTGYEFTVKANLALVIHSTEMQKLASALLRLKIKLPPIPHLAFIDVHILVLSIPVSRHFKHAVISPGNLQLSAWVDHCTPLAVKRNLVTRWDITEEQYSINSLVIISEALSTREVKIFIKRHINDSDITGDTTLAT